MRVSVERWPDPASGEQSAAALGGGFGKTSGAPLAKPVNARVIFERVQFAPIPKGQTTGSVGQQIASRVAQDVQAAKGTGGPSWVNRVLDAVRPLGYSPNDSAEVIEAATQAAGYRYGPRAALSDGTVVVTSARAGPGNFIIGIRPDGTIVRGTGNIEVGVNLPGYVRVTDVTWDQPK